MSNCIVNISLKWIKEPASCLTCIVCNDSIFSNTYRLNFEVNKNMSVTDMVVCESCYDVIK